MPRAFKNWRKNSAGITMFTWLLPNRNAVSQPLRVKEAELDFPVKGAYAVTGTPSDCVKLALHAVYTKIKFDAVVSGINHGPNLGSDVLYSGTVSAALEGAMNGLPSIAISLVNGHTKLADFDPAAQFVKDFLPKALAGNFPEKSVLNLNIPAVPLHDFAGVQVSELGVRMYSDTYERREDPRGGVYYWLAGEIVEEPESPTSDVEAIRNNMVSITPVHYDLTNYAALPDLAEVLDKKGPKKTAKKIQKKKPAQKARKKA